MPYADTDFFIALLKPGDRLAVSAAAVYGRYKGRIYTSLATIIELVIVGQRLNLDLERLIRSVMSMAYVDGIEQTSIEAVVHLIKNRHIGAFDAFHAVLSKGQIISSDHVYDGIGIGRIRF